MPKVDDNIIKAILAAADSMGSQAKLASKVGITPAALSRYLKGKVITINAATWNLIFPAIKDFLPEEYHRTFLSWKSQDDWRGFAADHPELFARLQKADEELDIAEIARTSNRYGRSDEWLKKLERTLQCVEQLDSYAMSFICAAADNKVNWHDLVHRRALERHIRKSERLTPEERLKFLDELDALANDKNENIG